MNPVERKTKDATHTRLIYKFGERNASIYVMCVFEHKTLAFVGRFFELTRERIRQIVYRCEKYLSHYKAKAVLSKEIQEATITLGEMKEQHGVRQKRFWNEAFPLLTYESMVLFSGRLRLTPPGFRDSMVQDATD